MDIRETDKYFYTRTEGTNYTSCLLATSIFTMIGLIGSLGYIIIKYQDC